jgi:hypothetical protein
VAGASALAEAAARAHGLAVIDRQLAGLVAQRRIEERCDGDAVELLTMQIDGLLDTRHAYLSVVGRPPGAP